MPNVTLIAAAADVYIACNLVTPRYSAIPTPAAFMPARLFVTCVVRARLLYSPALRSHSYRATLYALAGRAAIPILIARMIDRTSVPIGVEILPSGSTVHIGE